MRTFLIGLCLAFVLVTSPLRAHAAPDLSPKRAAEKVAHEPAPAATVTTPAPSSTKLWLKRSAWIAGAGAGVSTVAAVFFMYRANSKTGEFNSLRSGNRATCSTDYADNGGPRCSELLRQSESAKSWTLGALAATGILGVSAGVLGILAATRDDGPSVAIAPGELAASWRLRF